MEASSNGVQEVLILLYFIYENISLNSLSDNFVSLNLLTYFRSELINSL